MPTKEPPDSDNDSDVEVITGRDGDDADTAGGEEEAEEEEIIDDSDSAESADEE